MSQISSRARLPIIAIAGLLTLAVASNVWSSSPATVSIDPGVSPRLSGAEAVSIARDRIVASAKANGKVGTVVSAQAVKGTSLATEIEGGPGLEGDAANGVYWIVRGTGAFVAGHGLGAPQTSDSGYFIIDDATGEIVGMGMP